MTSQGTLVSPLEPQRRQNSSCDPCRRSKRRCFFSSSAFIDPSVSCVHCARLGRTCTFDFAASRLSSRPRRRQRQNTSTANSFSPFNESFISGGSLESVGSSSESASVLNSTSQQDDFAAWVDFDIDDCSESDLLPSQSADPAILDLQISTNSPEFRRRSHFLADSQTVRYPFPCGKDFVPGSSSRSPVHLLNSRLDASILDQRFISIYEAILTPSAARFLSHNTNLYSAGTRYRIENNNHGSLSDPQQEMDPSASNTQQHNACSLMKIPSQINPNEFSDSLTRHDHEMDLDMTILGCVRFLDHFGGLYGNPLTQSSKRKADVALKAALRVFAFQWLSNESPESHDHPAGYDNSVVDTYQIRQDMNSSCDFYTDAWYQARKAIEDAKSVRSFRCVLAIFVFDGTAVPTKARNDSNGNSLEHEFLNLGVQKLDCLDNLVKNYCATLGPYSKYGTLVKASLSLVRWSAYIRDTGAALTSSHKCQLPDPFGNGGGLAHEASIPSNFFLADVRECDALIPEICKRIAAEAFYIWRRIADVKTYLQSTVYNSCSIDSGVIDSIISVCDMMERFNEKIRPFIAHCRKLFCEISLAARVSCVTLVAPWDLGIFVFAEALEPHMNALRNKLPGGFGQLMQTYQQQAAASVAGTLECVLELPTEEAYNLRNGLASDTPITAYHVTPSIMTTAIEKAIVHIIRFQFSMSPHQMKPVNDSNFLANDLVLEQINCLMKGLLSLGVTVGGSQAVDPVLKTLMREYGDIISESWTCDFET